MDGKGQKMAKSKGNVIDPLGIIVNLYAEDCPPVMDPYDTMYFDWGDPTQMEYEFVNDQPGSYDLRVTLFLGNMMLIQAPMSIGFVVDNTWGIDPPYCGVDYSPNVYGCGTGYYDHEYWGEPRWTTYNDVAYCLDDEGVVAPLLARLALDGASAATELAREELADARRRLADAERLVKSRGIPETEVEARRSEVRADSATLKLREAEQQREQQQQPRQPPQQLAARELVEDVPRVEHVEALLGRGAVVTFLAQARVARRPREELEEGTRRAAVGEGHRLRRSSFAAVEVVVDQVLLFL